MLKFLDRFKKKKPPPEESVPFRAAVLLTVLTGIIAILHQEEWPGLSLPIISFNCLGFYLSYRWRHRNRTFLKLILAVLMIAALFDFLRNLRINPTDPRVALANLLMILQTLHSFDLPGRKDLTYSLLVALTLISLASALTISPVILVYYVLFITFSSAALMYGTAARFNQETDRRSELPVALVARTLSFLIPLLIGAAFIVLLFIPRYDNVILRSLPRSLVINLPSMTLGRLLNPGQRSAEDLRNSSANRLIWNPNSYFGFNSYVNLNFRGELSNVEVMKVQSSRWSYIRGLAFDVYDGKGWEITGENSDDFTEIPLRGQDFRVPMDDNVLLNWKESVEINQVFYVTQSMPNVIFGSYSVNQVFFPSELIYRDRNGSLRSPYVIEPGMIYSTISHHVPMSPRMVRYLEMREWYHRQEIRKNPDDSDRPLWSTLSPDDQERYLQLPDGFPGRVGSLTERILRENGAQDASVMRKVLVLSEYLKNNYTYDLKIPPFPDDRDAVDYFLFDEKRGYCEHFASALVVMLRTQNIPARMIFGYLPGEYDIFSRFYSVRQSDAHAWVEVYVPAYSWYSVDPTPGNGQTFSETRNRSHWLFLSLFEKLRDALADGRIPLGRIFLIVIVGGVLTVLYPFLIKSGKTPGLTWKSGEVKRSFFARFSSMIREYMSRAGSGSASFVDTRRDHAVFRVYQQMLREFGRLGYRKESFQTAREFVNTRVPGEFCAGVLAIVEAYEHARYGKDTGEGRESTDLEQLWKKIKIEIREYKKSR